MQAGSLPNRRTTAPGNDCVETDDTAAQPLPGPMPRRSAASPHVQTPTAVPFALLLALPVVAQSPHRFARENVLGTSAVLLVEAKDLATAEQAETAVFAEVARLDCVLSTWRKDSEVSRLVPGPTYTKVSADLATVVERATRMRAATQGAFEPGIAPLTALWTAAAAAGKAPAEQELTTAIAALKTPHWDLCGDGLRVDGPLALDGIAKGYIVDRAAAAAAKVPGVKLVSFQIGGDTWSARKSTFQLIDPRHPSENGTPLGTVDLQNLALASSGSYARGFDIGGEHHSHILDPRTGKPSDGVLGASVVAKDVATADALATTLCVLGPAGLPLLQQFQAHGVLVTADGKVHSSPNFTALHLTPESKPTATASDDKAWPAGFALQIDFDIKAPDTAGGRGRGGWKRPYVAVWIEDLTGAPARTLCLWIEDKRWLRDLRRWNRAHTETPAFADQVSQATRKAGSYTLSWDGKDDEGRQLVPGTYFVCIEAAREHGTYQLIRKEIELAKKATRLELDGNAEIDKAKLTFGKVARSSAK